MDIKDMFDHPEKYFSNFSPKAVKDMKDKFLRLKTVNNIKERIEMERNTTRPINLAAAKIEIKQMTQGE
jgi:hypothetical protein